MRLKLGAAIAAVAMGLLTAGSAAAQTYTFTLNGPFAAVWTIDTATSVKESASDYVLFRDAPGNYSAIPDNDGSVQYLADVLFYTSGFDGGLQLENFYNTDVNGDPKVLVSATGPQIFGGTTAAPTFTSGSYLLNDSSNSDTRYSLTISEVTAAVPEPATWSMMIAGFGMVGGSLRARRKVQAKPLAA